MIYLDNAATSFPKAPGVSEAMARFLDESAANPGRAGHRMAVSAEQMIDDVRLRLTRLVDGDDFRWMVFTLNCTDALNMAIKGVLGDAQSADDVHVITTVLEHNSVSRPLQALADSGRIGLTRVDCDDDGFVDPADIEAAIRPATRLIVMTHASNVLGTVQDVEAVGRVAREHDLLFLLDAAQTIGVLPVSIKSMQVDLLALPVHKSLLGPTGVGALYVGDRCDVDTLRPWREGGTGGDSSTPTQPTLWPYYLEGGTPNTVGIAGLAAALDYLVEHPAADTLAHERSMVQRIIDWAAEDGRFALHGPRDAGRRVGTVSIGVAGYDPSDVATILDDSFDIAARPGLHCAPYIHRRLGTFPDGLIRISPGPFNADDEVAALLDALGQIAG